MTKKKRKSSKPSFVVRDLEHARECVREAADLAGKNQRLEARLNSLVARLKERTANRAAPATARINEIEAALNVFATANKDALFADKKTIEVAGGKYGFRLQQIVVKPLRGNSWKPAIEAIKKAGEEFLKYLIQQEPEANKEALRELDAEALKKLELKKVGGSDAFFLELNPESLEKC